jgi:hypothetical protein
MVFAHNTPPKHNSYVYLSSHALTLRDNVPFHDQAIIPAFCAAHSVWTHTPFSSEFLRRTKMLSHLPEAVLQVIVEVAAPDLGSGSSSNAESALDDNFSEADNQTSCSEDDTDTYLGDKENSDEDMISIGVCSWKALSILPQDQWD